MLELKQALERNAAAIERLLQNFLSPDRPSEARLYEAMRYSTLAGGKRLRPFFVIQGARLFDVPEACAARAAVAIELIHCYSLIHDDLPAMDDDDLRRGQPTTHKKFDEATAILAGDALQPLAFEILSDAETHPSPAVRVSLIQALAAAAGAEGMVGGQMIDLEAEKRGNLTLGEITRLQALKTGALFAFSCEAGAILGEADTAARRALRSYADALGLAFQIADDLLDVEGSVEETGKAVNKDQAAGKATFVSLLGVEEAKQRANSLADDAIEHLGMFDDRAELLRQAARFVVERRS